MHKIYKNKELKIDEIKEIFKSSLKIATSYHIDFLNKKSFRRQETKEFSAEYYIENLITPKSFNTFIMRSSPLGEEFGEISSSIILDKNEYFLWIFMKKENFEEIINNHKLNLV